MFVRLVLTHKRGVPLPKRRIARSAELVGNVLTEYHDDRHLGRTVLVASFRVENMIGTAPMHLFEPRCVLIGQDGMILGGLEREAVESGFTEYAQGWWLRAELPPDRKGRRDYDDDNAARSDGVTSQGGDLPGWTRRLGK